MWLLSQRWLKSGLFLLFQFFYHTLFGFETSFGGLISLVSHSASTDFIGQKFSISGRTDLIGQKKLGVEHFQIFLQLRPVVGGLFLRLVAYFRGLAAAFTRGGLISLALEGLELDLDLAARRARGVPPGIAGGAHVVAGAGRMSANGTFCAGPGRVMMPGFTSSLWSGGCVLFLFQGWALDTPAKYALGVIAAFLFGFSNELLLWTRRKSTLRLAGPARGLLAVLYGAHMVLAYWMMLLVMTYEAILFTAIILGLATGHLLFSVILLDRDEPALTGSSPCCGGSEVKPLLVQERSL
jgi:hypothetical protein